MSLANEAAYLYVFSKKLQKLNKKLQKYSIRAEKHLKKHQLASSEQERNKIRQKHQDATGKIKELMKEHNIILEKIRHHQIAFAHSLQKQHKI